MFLCRCCQSFFQSFWLKGWHVGEIYIWIWKHIPIIQVCYTLVCYRGFPGGSDDKESAFTDLLCRRPGLDPWVGKIPWRREWLPTPAFLPGEFHGYTITFLEDWTPKRSFLGKKRMCVLSCSVVSNSLQPHGLKPARLLRPWNSPGKNTGVASHSLLQGILPTQGSKPGFLHCRQNLYHLSHQGSLYFQIKTGK